MDFGFIPSIMALVGKYVGRFNPGSFCRRTKYFLVAVTADTWPFAVISEFPELPR